MPRKLTLRKDWPLLHDILKDELPHGSGIDADWNIHPASGHGIACSNSYHAMDCMGSYVDWLDFTVYYGWNIEQQQFEFKKLVADRHAVWMTDEEGDRYNDREGIVDYLNDCFPNEIPVRHPTFEEILKRMNNYAGTRRVVWSDAERWVFQVEAYGEKAHILDIQVQMVMDGFHVPVEWRIVASGKHAGATTNEYEMTIQVEVPND
jgi:hypothetical protein